MAIYAGLAWSGSWSKGVSFDEGQQLAIGYNLWVNGDYRIEGGNGDLVKRWSTLPYLISRPAFLSNDDPVWHRADPYDIAHRFFFQLGNRPEQLLRQGRAMMVLLGLATGLLVFCCSREIFGVGGGLLSAIVFALSPHMLAFGGLVSTDLSIALTLFGATWCVWRLLHEVTMLRVLASLGMFGLLVLAKPSALAILPITGLLVAAKLSCGRPLMVRWSGLSRTFVSRRVQSSVFAALVLLHAAAGWGAIWAHYGFRYAASPDLKDTRLLMQATPPGGDREPRVADAILDWSRRTHFLPEGFRKGIRQLLGGVKHLRSFMNGEWTIGGRWEFFPYAIWVKTQPVTWLLLGLGGIAWWRASRRAALTAASPAGPGSEPATIPRLYAATPYLVLIAVYLAIAMSEEVNLGHRHVLPIYPAFYVLAGAAVYLWRAAPWGQLVITGLLLWRAADSWVTRPHYLAYFGPQAGGSDAGYRHLVDSSLDWGMDLPGLRSWLDENDPHRRERLHLAYFGTDDPNYYGIKCRRLPASFDSREEVKPSPLAPGYYAISATQLQSVHAVAFGPWTQDYENKYQEVRRNLEIYNLTGQNFAARAELIRTAPPNYWDFASRSYDHLRLARLCAWLRHQGDPPFHVGHALFIWKLEDADLQAALGGPPPELEESPAVPEPSE